MLFIVLSITTLHYQKIVLITKGLWRVGHWELNDGLSANSHTTICTQHKTALMFNTTLIVERPSHSSPHTCHCQPLNSPFTTQSLQPSTVMDIQHFYKVLISFLVRCIKMSWWSTEKVTLVFLIFLSQEPLTTQFGLGGLKVAYSPQHQPTRAVLSC